LRLCSTLKVAEVADGQPADLAGRAQVPLHQLRREVLHVRHVVVAGADRVGREPGIDVDVDANQVLYGSRILGAIQALEGPPAGTWIGGGHGVHGALEGMHHRHHGPIVRTRGSRGRHHARTELTDDLLGEFSVVTGLRRVEPGERQASRLGPGGVTGRAVLADEGILIRHRHADGRGRRPM
jgi:hypothetical protein